LAGEARYSYNESVPQLIEDEPVEIEEEIPAEENEPLERIEKDPDTPIQRMLATNRRRYPGSECCYRSASGSQFLAKPI
jgi:hypothetical protein